MKMGKKLITGHCLCLNIYPKALGGVKYETLPVSGIDKEADLWKKIENGKFYYLQVWSAEKEKLVAYHPLPEVITITADYLVRVLSCPYTRLKAIKTGLLSKLAGWIPVAVLGGGIFLLIIVGG